MRDWARSPRDFRYCADAVKESIGCRDEARARGHILDFDGTVVDSETAFVNAWRELLAERGMYVTTPDLEPHIGASGSDVQARWENQLRMWLGPAIDAAALDAEGDRRIEERRLALSLLPGVRDLLWQARELTWRVGLATGTKRGQVERHLRRLTVLEHFDAIVRTQVVERPKPAPDIYLEAARRLSVPTHRCVAIEDSPIGCAAAMAAGMTVVVCPCSVTQALDFPTGASRVSSVADIDLAARLP